MDCRIYYYRAFLEVYTIACDAVNRIKLQNTHSLIFSNNATIQ